MKQFINIFTIINTKVVNINFKKLAELRKYILESQGVNTNSINWNHYVNVLEAKNKLINQ